MSSRQHQQLITSASWFLALSSFLSVFTVLCLCLLLQASRSCVLRWTCCVRLSEIPAVTLRVDSSQSSCSTSPWASWTRRSAHCCPAHTVKMLLRLHLSPLLWRSLHWRNSLLLFCWFDQTSAQMSTAASTFWTGTSQSWGVTWRSSPGPQPMMPLASPELIRFRKRPSRMSGSSFLQRFFLFFLFFMFSCHPAHSGVQNMDVFVAGSGSAVHSDQSDPQSSGSAVEAEPAWAPPVSSEDGWSSSGVLLSAAQRPADCQHTPQQYGETSLLASSCGSVRL